MIIDNSELVLKGSIPDIVGRRDRAIDLYRQGIDVLVQGFKAHKDACQGDYWLTVEIERHRLWDTDSSPSAIENMAEIIRQNVDRDVWSYVIEAVGLRNFMDHAELEKMHRQLDENPPIISVESIEATLIDLGQKRLEYFRRGIFNLYKRLSRTKFASNDAFKFGPRMVVPHAFDRLDRFNMWRMNRRDEIDDLDRIFHVIDGKQSPDHRGGLASLIDSVAREQELETEYFSCRWFRNGNLHINIKREDLLTRLNKMLAEEYGPSLGARRKH